MAAVVVVTVGVATAVVTATGTATNLHATCESIILGYHLAAGLKCQEQASFVERCRAVIPS